MDGWGLLHLHHDSNPSTERMHLLASRSEIKPGWLGSNRNIHSATASPSTAHVRFRWMGIPDDRFCQFGEAEGRCGIYLWVQQWRADHLYYSFPALTYSGHESVSPPLPHLHCSERLLTTQSIEKRCFKGLISFPCEKPSPLWRTRRVRYLFCFSLVTA